MPTYLETRKITRRNYRDNIDVSRLRLVSDSGLFLSGTRQTNSLTRVASRSDNHVLLVLLSHPRVSSNSSESASSRQYYFDEIRYFSLRDD